MTQPPTISRRPKRYPPPEFPPRRPKLFAKTPPAVFPSILGLLGLAGAVRLMLGRLGLDPGPGDLLAGLAVALWAFAAVAYGVKLARRIAVRTGCSNYLVLVGWSRGQRPPFALSGTFSHPSDGRRETSPRVPSPVGEANGRRCPKGG